MWDTAVQPEERTAAPADEHRRPQQPGLLRLQRLAGNAAVARHLQREDPPKPPDHGLNGELEQQFMDEAAKISPQLDADVDPAAAAKATAGAAGGQGGGNTYKPWFYELQAKLSTTKKWGDVEIKAQDLLSRYVHAVAAQTNQPVPANVADLLDYLGSGKANAAAADTRVFQDRNDPYSDARSSRDLTGTPDAQDWCTGATTRGMFAGLKSMNYAPDRDETEWINLISGSGEGKTIGAKEAYKLPLHPGDQVMFLFKGCQHGGHTVTVIDDYGDSFTHVSGNTTGRGGASSVGAGESTRRSDDSGIDLGKAKSATDTAGAKTEIDRATATWAAGEVLTYSIVSYSSMFAQLDELRIHATNPGTDPEAWKAERAKLATKWHLRVVDPSLGPPAPPAAAPSPAAAPAT